MNQFNAYTVNEDSFNIIAIMKKIYTLLFASLLLSNTLKSQQWQILNAIPTNKHLESIFFTDNNTGYIVGENGTILKTTDGINWMSQPSGTGEKLKFVHFTETNTGYIAGENGTVLKIAGTITGFADNPVSSDYMNIYPNPTGNMLTIDLNNPNDNINGELTIFDIHGKSVLNQLLFRKKTTIPLSDLKPGVYFITLKDDQKLTTKKLIINHD